MNTVLAQSSKKFNIGNNSYKLKVELSKKRKMSQSSTQFIVNGNKYSINWTHKRIDGKGADWRIDSFHSEGLYPIYKSLLSRGFTERANYIKKVIESCFGRIGYYVYTNRDSQSLPKKKINSVIDLLKSKKVSFIHTEQDYRPRKEDSGQRCIIHFDRTELPKLIGQKAYKDLNPQFAETLKNFSIQDFKFSEMREDDDIYWADSISVHYKLGKRTIKTASGHLQGEHHLHLID